MYDKAIALSNEYASYFNNRGAAYFATKQYERASADYATALQLDPDIFERNLARRSSRPNCPLPRNAPTTIMFSPRSTPSLASRTVRCTI